MTRRRIGDDPAVKEWTTFYIALADGTRKTHRAIESLTDGELAWVLQRSFAEVERRKVARENYKRMAKASASIAAKAGV